MGSQYFSNISNVGGTYGDKRIGGFLFNNRD